MNQQELYQTFKILKVIPIINIEQAEATLPLANALIEGGLPIVEITFRTEAAAKVIEKLAKERANLMVGAGTILTVDNLKKPGIVVPNQKNLCKWKLRVLDMFMM